MGLDVAVVGGGPAGLLAAQGLARDGWSVGVYEEHPRLGRPVHCAGLISVEGLERLGLGGERGFVLNEIYGVKAYSPSGVSLGFRDRRVRALAVDRAGLDEALGQEALDAGARLELGVRVRSLRAGKGGPGILVGESEVHPRLVVDAEGASAGLVSRAGLSKGPRGRLKGYNVEVGGEVEDEGVVEVWLGSQFSVGLFAWVIPLGSGLARCGLATRVKGGLEVLRRFVEKRFPGASMGPVEGGLVCTGGPVDETVFPGVVLVGDVAGQVKATTGGGVVTGGLCAQVAARVLSHALEAPEPWKAAMAYEGEWRRLLGGELRAMVGLRRVINTLGDAQLDRFFAAAKEEELAERLGGLLSQGDMDLQAGVIGRGLRDPGLLGALVRVAGRAAVSSLLEALGLTPG